MDRSTTPPPQFPYLLTPPPTGGLDQRDGYMDFKTDTKSKHLGEHIEGESPTSFFDDAQEGSDIERRDSEQEFSSSTYGTVPTSPVSETSNQSITVANTNESDLLKSLTTPIEAPSVTEPFPLLKLPLFVRQQVYEHLLVVPGLIWVRQKHNGSHGTEESSVRPEDRVLLPGIAYGLAQLTFDGPKIGFSCFVSTNIDILLASKEVHAEAKAVLYTKNNFDIARPSTELSPPSDYSVRLFPPGCQRLVAKLNICIRSFYDLHWLLSGGYNDIKNFYRGIKTLTLILELDSVDKGFARQWAKHEVEKWTVYVKRLQIEIAKDAFAANKVAAGKAKNVKNIPTWINLRVLFHGESYDQTLKCASPTVTKWAKRDELRDGLVQAWELFKKGDR